MKTTYLVKSRWYEDNYQHGVFVYRFEVDPDISDVKETIQRAAVDWWNSPDGQAAVQEEFFTFSSPTWSDTWDRVPNTWWARYGLHLHNTDPEVDFDHDEVLDGVHLPEEGEDGDPPEQSCPNPMCDSECNVCSGTGRV